jgi:hypothetical protein
MEVNVRLPLPPLYPRRRISKNALNKSFNETQCWSGRNSEDKYPQPCYKSNPVLINHSQCFTGSSVAIHHITRYYRHWAPVLLFPLAQQPSRNVPVDADFAFDKITVLVEMIKEHPVHITTYTKLTLIDSYQCCGTMCRGCHEIRSHY